MTTRTRGVTVIGAALWWTLYCVGVVWAAEPVVEPVKVPREPAPPAPKIEKALGESLAALRDDEMLDVEIGIWFAIPDYETVAAMQLEDPRDEEGRAGIRAALNQRIAQGSQPLVAALAAKAITPTYVSTHAPVLFAHLGKTTTEELSRRDDVQAIYLTRTYQPAMEHAAKTERADVVWARGIDGSATTDIAIVEVPWPTQPTRARIDRPNGYLAGANNLNTAFRPGQPAGNHATWVAGRVAAVRQAGAPDRWRGIAPGVAPLLSANASLGTTADVVSASDWALGLNAEILNFSMEYAGFTGVPNLLARYIDFIVRDHWVTVTTAAGNQGANLGHVVTNPGLAYNSITVGAFEDNDDNRWENPNDTMWAGSCFRDPPDAAPAVGIDRELPEVAAVGATVESTGIGGIGGAQSGTSLASPAVAGIAALILDRDPTLFNDPEVVKAIIMAGACHNIEGSSRLSDKDGAGGVVACEADEITRDGHFDHKILTDTDFAGGVPGGNWSFNGMNLKRSLKARVVISWLVPAGGAPNYTYPWVVPNLPADLDLRVYNPNGTLAASSLSYDNNYEIVEFTPTATGVHRIEVRAFTWAGGQNAPLGVAWTQEPCCSPDWGDAPDDMQTCPTRPHKGNFPTREVSTGANVREFEVEWLSRDNTTTPGATWEMDAWVPHFREEKDQDGQHNIVLPPGPDPLCNPALDGPCCTANQDREDDGVVPDALYIAGTRGRVSFYVNSATPNVGRYSSSTNPDERLYVWGWFDWEHDDTTWDGNLMVKWIGGPSLTGAMPVGTCIEGCDQWDPTAHQKKVTAEFDVPEFANEGPFWIRFRLSYGELNKKDGATEVDWTDKTVYGEIEDHISYQLLPIEVDEFEYTEAVVEMITPFGNEIVTVNGPTTVHVDLASLGDTDDDGLEDVPTEIVQMELTGYSDLLGSSVVVTVRPETSEPFERSTGWIEEKSNDTPGILDISPFTATGAASSVFLIYFEIEVAGEILHNDAPKRMEGQITHKPPGPDERYESPETIPLYYEDGALSDYRLRNAKHVPNPQNRGACCDGTTGVCEDDVFELSCEGDQQVWFKGMACTAVPCSQHRGACCDKVLGGCDDNVGPADCVGGDLRWHKGGICEEIECPAVSEWGMVIIVLLLVTGITLKFAWRRPHNTVE